MRGKAYRYEEGSDLDRSYTPCQKDEFKKNFCLTPTGPVGCLEEF